MTIPSLHLTEKQLLFDHNLRYISLLEYYFLWYDKSRPMETKIFTMQELPQVVTLLQGNELVAFPTETVFGLAANAESDIACKKIYQVKGRPQDNPFIVHIASLDKLPTVARDIPQIAYQLFQHFSPGPLTIVLLKATNISSVATAGLETVAVRIPSHPIAQALLLACNFPLAAPSANRSGRPSPTSSRMVMQELQGEIPGILDGVDSIYGLESTVISCVGEQIFLLRPGAVDLESLQHFLGTHGRSITTPTMLMKDLRSPGTKHPHYKPNYPLKLCHRDDIPTLVKEYKNKKIGLLVLYHEKQSKLWENCDLWQVKIFLSIDEYARQLYQSLVEFERFNVEITYAESPAQESVGLALYDRLKRAAAN